jgi:seryl-tRNA synthetase
MLQVANIAADKEAAIAGLRKKRFKDLDKVEHLLQLDEQRKKLQYQMDETKAKANSISKEVGALFAQGKRDEADVLKNQAPILKEEIKVMEEEHKKVEQDLYDILVTLPNLPHYTVPEGGTPEENEEVRRGGTIPTLEPTAKPHWELIEQYNIIDLALGTKITGAGFPVYKGKGARLQRALISFFLDQAAGAGYQEIIPPFMVNAASAFGTGQLPDKEGQMYHMPVDGFYMIPTAEVPVTNIYRDEILREEDLPIKLCAYSPCFRREAGSYGADVRGLNRVHQFDKVEIVQMQTPDKSYQTLEEMLAHVEGLLKQLGLPYRILRLCGGDMSFTSALTYDFEVFSAAQQRWLEVSSVSNFETFQSNRMKIRYRDTGKGNQLVHTLNGSALALPRIVASILENYQTTEGIFIPEVLRPYTGFDRL